MTACIGIDVGCTLDMIENNVELMKKLEVARLDMYISKERDSNKENTFCSPSIIDTGDAYLNELLSNGENYKASMEEKYLNKLI